MPVLDAAFLIAVERRHRAATALADRLAGAPRPIWIPAVAWMEYLSGFRTDEQASAVAILESIGTLAPFDQPVAQLAGVLQSGFLRSGRRMQWNDVQVAATALHLRDAVVTLDGDFSGIAGLEAIHP